MIARSNNGAPSLLIVERSRSVAQHPSTRRRKGDGEKREGGREGDGERSSGVLRPAGTTHRAQPRIIELNRAGEERYNAVNLPAPPISRFVMLPF